MIKAQRVDSHNHCGSESRKMNICPAGQGGALSFGGGG